MFNITPTKSSRKILSNGVTPSISITPARKENKENLESRVHDHAYSRILFARERFQAIYSTYPQSLPLSDRLKVEVHGAYLQGSQSKKARYHAAHMNGEAGFRDNIRKLAQALIIQEKRVPTEISIILQAKGFNEQDVEKMEKGNWEEGVVKPLFDKRWTKGVSILSGTELDHTLNATNDMPRDLNLYCDGKLEKNKTRNKLVPDLSKEVVLGNLGPWEATEKYQKEVRQFFYDGSVKNHERVEALTQLYLDVKACYLFETEHFDGKSSPGLNELKTYIDTVQKVFDALGDLSRSSDHCIGLDLERTKAFFKPLMEVKKSTKFSSIRRVWKKNHPKPTTVAKSGMGAEICRTKVRIQKIYDYFTWEFVGSRLPPSEKFLHHAGYDKENNHLNTPTKTENVASQKRVLKPLHIHFDK